MLFAGCFMYRSSDKPKEKYKYYDAGFVLPANSSLKTNGIYCDTSYHKPYGKPAAVSWGYYQFKNNGSYVVVNGFKSKAEMLKAIQDSTFSFKNIYKIEGNIVGMESYGNYRMSFDYQYARIVGDTLFVKYGKIENDRSPEKKGVAYVFREIKDM